jgi:hypothetical protein
MNIAENIKVNQQILKLIRSKYPDEAWPAGSPKGNVEVKYYQQLESDLEKAKYGLQKLGVSVLAGGGLATTADPGSGA